MNGFLFRWLGIASGIFFIFAADQFGLFSLGVFLASLGVAGQLDKRGILPAIKSVIQLQYKRIAALIRLYKMAPIVLANQERMQRIAKRLDLVEGRTEMWLQIAQSTASLQKAVGAVQWHSHCADQNAHFAQEVAKAGLSEELGSSVGDQSNLVITDIGKGFIDSKSLNSFLNGDVEIDFWIGKRVVGDSDLLVIPRPIFSSSPRLIEGVVAKLSSQYSRVFIFAHEDAKSFWNGDNSAVRGIGNIDEVHVTRDPRRIIEAT